MTNYNKSKLKIAWLLISIFYAYQYILRVLPNVMMSQIINDFNMDGSSFGQFLGIYYVGYALVHIPIGILLDRIGLKKIIPICIIFTSIGTMTLLFPGNWLLPTFGRLMLGIGSSAAILGIFNILRIAYPDSKFTRMLGISVTIGLIGAIYGGQPVFYLVSKFGYDFVIKSIILIGILLAVTIYLITPKIRSNKDLDESIITDIKEVLNNKKVLFVCLLSGLMISPLEGFADGWSTEFLKSIYKFSETISSSLPSLIYLGMSFGASILSYVADKRKIYLEVIIFAALAMSICFILLLFGVGNQFLVSVMLFIIGIMCAYQIPAIYKLINYVPKKLTTITTALANMIFMIFGYVTHSLIGKSMDLFSSNGEYSEKSFIISISIIPILLLISAIGFLTILVREKRKNKKVL